MYQSNITDDNLRAAYLKAQDNYSTQTLEHEINLLTSFIMRHLQTLDDPTFLDKNILRLIETKRKLVESENKRNDLQLKLNLMRQKFDYDKSKKVSESDVRMHVSKLAELISDEVPLEHIPELLKRIDMELNTLMDECF